jgi:hypothetical protein
MISPTIAPNEFGGHSELYMRPKGSTTVLPPVRLVGGKPAKNCVVEPSSGTSREPSSYGAGSNSM